VRRSVPSRKDRVPLLTQLRNPLEILNLQKRNIKLES